MAIEKIDVNLPLSSYKDEVNDTLVTLGGETAQAAFDKLEMSTLYSGSGIKRKYHRQFPLLIQNT